MKKQILSLINRLGERLPKKLQRAIVDFPGVLALLGKLSSGAKEQVVSPEGYLIEINPLFHSNLTKNRGLECYEPDMRQAIIRLSEPGFTAYDIGANVGIFSFLFLSLVGPKGHVYAFEPEPNNNECLRRSIEKSGTDGITLDRRAVGNKVDVALFDRRGGAFSGRLVSDNEKYNPTDNIIEVRSTTLDRLVSDEGYFLPDIMNIDVEGNEALVLSGMTGILRDNPPIIICELHQHLGDSVEKVEVILGEAGYRLYAITDFLNLPADKLIQISSLRGTRHVVALSARK